MAYRIISRGENLFRLSIFLESRRLMDVVDFITIEYLLDLGPLYTSIIQIGHEKLAIRLDDGYSRLRNTE